MIPEVSIAAIVDQAVERALRKHLGDGIAKTIGKSPLYSMEEADRVRDLAATAAYLGTTKGAVQALVKRGDLKSLQIGNSLYVAQSAIHEWIEQEHKQQERENYRREVMPVGVDPEIEKALKKR